MAKRPERSISDALFGPLPEETRRRIGLDRYPEPRTGNSQRGTDQHSLPAPRPDAPSSPWGMRPSEWWQVLKQTVRKISEDRVTSIAGGVTFFSLLALFPAITALVSIFGLVADPEAIADNLTLLEEFLPPSAYNIISGQVNSIVNAPGTALSFAGIAGLLATLWSANGGMKALIDALNVAWMQRERRGFVMLTVVSLGMTLGAIALVIAMIAAITVLPAVLNWLPIPAETKSSVGLIRWPIMFGVLIFAIAALYRWGPSRGKARFRLLSPGSLFASIGLVVASVAFSFYAANFAGYNETYGTLGAVIALMMWLWIASIVIMVGAELNSVSERHLSALQGRVNDVAAAGRKSTTENAGT